jgi:probable F420-dependent oxidoreductase
MPAISIGVLITPQDGDIATMRRTWEGADAIGVDTIYTSDHFIAPTKAEREESLRAAGIIPEDDGTDAAVTSSAATERVSNWESLSIQAAAAVTTKRAEIGCLVTCNGWRNPNLLADMTRTIDHLSGGRYRLALGAGYFRADFDEYGFVYGTAASRWLNLERDLETMRSRWAKLTPPPTRPIPVTIGAAGEKIALKVVAKHADTWHGYGTPAQYQHKSKVLDDWCERVGRDPASIGRSTSLGTALSGSAGPDDFAAIGVTELVMHLWGPRWDLEPLRELLAWRERANAATV